MSILTVMPSGKTIEVGEGTSLPSALLGAEIGILTSARGRPNAEAATSSYRKDARPVESGPRGE
jgi:hypothetical protein